MPPKKFTRFLVVRADGSMRIINSRTHARRLRLDEVAYEITVTMPASWGQLAEGGINITMPEAPEVTGDLIELKRESS